MPSYDYRCEQNGQVVEVSHKMSEKLSTWGEVCDKANLELGDTPADSPVVRLITGGNVVSRSALSNPDAPACGTGGCAGGMCGLN